MHPASYGTWAHLWKIEGDGAGALHAGDLRAQQGRERGERPEGAIDMEPEVLARCDLRDAGEVIEGADIHRARGADDKEGCEPGGAIGGDCLSECREVHAEIAVDGNAAEGRAADSGHIHRIGHTAMDAGGGVGREPGLAETFGAHASAKCRDTGQEHRDEVRHRAAGDEQPAGSRW